MLGGRATQQLAQRRHYVGVAWAQLHTHTDTHTHVSFPYVLLCTCVCMRVCACHTMNTCVCLTFFSAYPRFASPCAAKACAAVGLARRAVTAAHVRCHTGPGSPPCSAKAYATLHRSYVRTHTHTHRENIRTHTRTHTQRTYLHTQRNTPGLNKQDVGIIVRLRCMQGSWLGWRKEAPCVCVGPCVCVCVCVSHLFVCRVS